MPDDDAYLISSLYHDYSGLISFQKRTFAPSLRGEAGTIADIRHDALRRAITALITA